MPIDYRGHAHRTGPGAFGFRRGELKGRGPLEEAPDFIRAARVSLGTLGIFSCLRIRVQPAYKLHRQEWCTGVRECMETLTELIDPEAMPLETDYGAVVEASVPIVVQFTTMDTRQSANTRSISLGY